MRAEQNCGTVLAEALDVVGWVQHALVFATAAYGDERHLGVDELSVCAAEVSIIAGRHSHVPNDALLTTHDCLVSYWANNH